VVYFTISFSKKIIKIISIGGMVMSTYVIGDIHGEITQLKKILSKINYDSSADKLIFLGDYIDRGEDPYQVYNLIQNLNCDENVFLKGNHEDMMTNAVLRKEQVNLWYYNGGQITKNSFPHQKELEAAAVWFDSLPYYYTTEEYIFVHAGIDPYREIDDQDQHELLWIRNQFLNVEAKEFKDKRIIVAGHTPVPEVRFTENKILLDTGAGKGGILSAIELESKQVFKAKKRNPLAGLF